jgi:hypothetical protein
MTHDSQEGALIVILVSVAGAGGWDCVVVGVGVGPFAVVPAQPANKSEATVAVASSERRTTEFTTDTSQKVAISVAAPRAPR